MSDPSGVWAQQARQWERVGAPLRPAPRDHEFMLEAAASCGVRALRVLQLGVTPELPRLPWPAATRLVAVDHSREMINRVWPGFAGAGGDVICADWRHLPVAASSIDLVIGDGPFGVLRYPDDYRDLLEALRMALTTTGIFTFRVFTMPPVRESPSAVFRAAMAGEVDSFHAFKLRLLMAAQTATSSGVCTGDVWALWHDEGPDVAALAARTGWPVEQIATIDAYRDQDSVYSFPTLIELREVLAATGFVEHQCRTPDYALGERCPSLRGGFSKGRAGGGAP